MKTQMCAYDICRHYISDTAELLGPDLTSLALGKVRARDYEGLASFSSNCDMHSFNVTQYATVRQIEAFFKKNADFAIDEECTANAMSSFDRGERICRIANRRLDYYYSQRDRLDLDLRFWLDRAESYISGTLGSIHDFASSFSSMLRITSGASATSPRSTSLPFQKLERHVWCTPSCKPYFKAACREFGYAAPKVKTMAWNRVEVVPKSWKTHRTIACEPAGNVPFQLAFDEYAKGCLRDKRGIDLSSQIENQRHAKEGSITGRLATIDLSMASDTLSFQCVEWLLPIPWLNYLSDIRCSHYRLNGKLARYAKFSSMGNGATFALETLIFASLLYAVGSKRGIAYGDDLTIETELVPKLFKLLKFLGFVPNEEKSYFAGPFRESCGKDYFNGIDITPFYLRSTAAWNKPYACHNVNGLAQLAPHGALWEYLRSVVNDLELPKVPVGYNTLAGVFLHPSFAYDQGLIRRFHKKRNDGILASREYVSKGHTIECWDSRASFLWHLRKANAKAEAFPPGGPRGIPCGPEKISSVINTSRYTTSGHKYVRKWVAWNYPSKGGMEELFSFSDYLTV